MFLLPHPFPFQREFLPVVRDVCSPQTVDIGKSILNVGTLCRGEPYTEKAYYEKLARGFAALTRGAPSGDTSQRSALVLDAANGVGGPKWQALAQHLQGGLTVEVTPILFRELLEQESFPPLKRSESIEFLRQSLRQTRKGKVSIEQ